eukprot:gene3496-3765_t
MAMLCAISGTVPEQPMVSKKSGHVFEKTLIIKYIAETGKCPITGVDLAEDDLLQVTTSKTIKPRSSAATSIPGLMGIFHDEWDALMLEHHTLRQNLHTHDAACRVIARLLRERDEARAALSTLREDMRAEMEAAEARKRAAQEEEEEGGPAKRSKQEALSPEVVEVLTE